MTEALLFYPLAALVLGFAVVVIGARNPVHAVIGLVANTLAVAVVFLCLRAEFLAVSQVIVYAGGVVVLYLFVVMLVNLKTGPPELAVPRPSAGIGVMAGGLMVAIVTSAVLYASATGVGPLVAAADAGVDASASNTLRVGLGLFRGYLGPFELASMLLLAALVGAIVLARRDA